MCEVCVGGCVPRDLCMCACWQFGEKSLNFTFVFFSSAVVAPLPPRIRSVSMHYSEYFALSILEDANQRK